MGTAAAASPFDVAHSRLLRSKPTRPYPWTPSQGTADPHPSCLVRRELGSLQRVADLTELIADLGTEKQRSGNHHHGDKGNQQGVLHHAGPFLILQKSALVSRPRTNHVFLLKGDPQDQYSPIGRLSKRSSDPFPDTMTSALHPSRRAFAQPMARTHPPPPREISLAQSMAEAALGDDLVRDAPSRRPRPVSGSTTRSFPADELSTGSVPSMPSLPHLGDLRLRRPSRHRAPPDENPQLSPMVLRSRLEAAGIKYQVSEGRFSVPTLGCGPARRPWPGGAGDAPPLRTWLLGTLW